MTHGGHVQVDRPWLHVHPIHGEGVVWDVEARQLLFVDVTAGTVWWCDPALGTSRSQHVADSVGAVHPTTETDTFIVADGDGIALVRGAAVSRLASPLAGRPDLRMNDANVDPVGRFLAGSMAQDASPDAGGLLRYSPGHGLEVLIAPTTISNGIDWSPDGRLCYFVDSPLRRVDVFAYDVATGAMTDRRVFVDVSDVPGIPDGLTVDRDGGVWVAFFGGSRVCRFAPDGRLDVTVHLPTSQVTSCCFGGDDLGDLFVSTSTEALTPEQRRAQPAAGAVFRVPVGRTGRPGNRYRIRA